MKRLILFGFIFVLFVLFIVVKYSEVETALVCKVRQTIEGIARPSEITLSLKKYRWWVSLWSDGTDGNIRVEKPGEWTQWYPEIELLGDSWHIYESKERPQTIGVLSRISMKIDIVTAYGNFDGSCSVVTPL